MTTTILPPSRLGYLPPNWFAAVMGTGVIAVAADGLRWGEPVTGAVAGVFWVLSAVLLAVVIAATAAHWWTHPEVASGHHRHPVIRHFYGAAPMAVLTVGTATLLVGEAVLGPRIAAAIALGCWIVGTVGGLATLVTFPFRILRQPTATEEAFGGWLMPVVPPMVSASAGALLIGHLESADARLAMLLVCYILFAVALVAAIPIIGLILLRLRRRGPGAATMVPTCWIVLGPLGQSVTAAGLLGAGAGTAVGDGVAAALRRFGLAYGLPVWCLAIGWAVVAATITARTARTGLPFGLTWWSFTFPVGTVVTGAAALAAGLDGAPETGTHPGAVGFAVAATVGFTALAGACSSSPPAPSGASSTGRCAGPLTSRRVDVPARSAPRADR